MAGNKLTQLLKTQAGSPTPPAGATVAQTSRQDACATEDAEVWVDVEDLLQNIESIECEAIVGGALQRVRFTAHTNPATVKQILTALDPGVKVRNEFPSRGQGGNRDVKLARALVINARITDQGKFVDLVCQNGEDLTVAVSKKNSDGFLDQLKAVGRVTELHLARLQQAFTDKKSATVILAADEQFGVKYFTLDDGRAYLDSLTAEVPADGKAASQ